MIKLNSHQKLIRGGTSIIWDHARWPNFSRAELSCRHCGDYIHDIEFLDRLQALRARLKRSVRILSGHRCALHNARVGGAPLSHHLRMAVDVDISTHNRRDLVRIAQEVGFTGFGYYRTFLHLDMGRPRFWYGSEKAKKTWQTFLD